MLPDLKSEVRLYSDPQKARNSMWFFKTGKGDYGEGDKFLGLTTPQMRKISAHYKNLAFSDIQKLIKSPYHEERSIAIQILVWQYRGQPGNVYNFYLKNTKYINNWDLVDISAPKIVGTYLLDKSTKILSKLAASDSLWERRIAIISTMAFITRGNPDPALQISKLLLNDREDLIHKAVGWMLREVGKKCSQAVEEAFLKQNYDRLPRTTLRYAIERFPENKRLQYLKGLI